MAFDLLESKTTKHKKHNTPMRLAFRATLVRSVRCYIYGQVLITKCNVFMRNKDTKTDCAAIDYKKKEKRRELKNENNQTTVREVDRIETEEIQITHPAII